MATATLEIVIPGKSQKCSIFFGEFLNGQFPAEILSEATSLAVLTDDLVARFYGNALRKALMPSRKAEFITIPHGEKSKTIATACRVAKILSDYQLDRKSVLLALGGGVVGDLAGFVASVFKRGISYFQIPTTLLAQVDSSIGGKSAVDTEWGKNQLGTFYQPSGIFVDTSCLDTLPQKEIVNGIAEITKSAIIADSGMFKEIESRTDEYFTIERLKSLVRRTVEIKARVVQVDEREENLRKILNYGHTVGHAIEASSDYRLSHGRCVILGMLSEGWIARKLGIFNESDYQRQKQLLQKLNTHYKIPELGLDKKRVLSFAMLDKKNTSGKIMMSLPAEIGRMYKDDSGRFTTQVSKELFLESLGHFRS